MTSVGYVVGVEAFTHGCRSISHAIDHKGDVVGVRRSIPVEPFRLGGAVEADLKTGSDSKRERGTSGVSIMCRLISGVGATSSKHVDVRLVGGRARCIRSWSPSCAGALAVPRGVAVFDVVVGAGASWCVSAWRVGCAAASSGGRAAASEVGVRAKQGWSSRADPSASAGFMSRGRCRARWETHDSAA